LASAGLETFAVEPLPSDSPLLSLENVTLTPHIADFSIETINHVAEMVTKDIALWYSGKTPANCFNPEVLAV